jgi:aminoglycoside phosphotransferase (APT) family kinase protein
VTLSAEELAWVRDSLGLGAQVISAHRMPISATQKDRIIAQTSEGAISLVLRRYHDAQRLGIDPWYDPAAEAAVLWLLEPEDVPSPRLYAADIEGERCEAASLLESLETGEPGWHPRDLDTYLRTAAEVLVRIHVVPPKDVRDYEPYTRPGTATPPSWTHDPAMWERVLEILDEPWPGGPTTFIHRDYHPGNVLAVEDRVSAVVDWATGASGPPGIDLARMRQNLIDVAGVEAADEFRELYLDCGGGLDVWHPYWDLLDAVDSLEGWSAPRNLEEEQEASRFEDHVAGVLSELR